MTGRCPRGCTNTRVVTGPSGWKTWCATCGTQLTGAGAGRPQPAWDDPHIPAWPAVAVLLFAVVGAASCFWFLFFAPTR